MKYLFAAIAAVAAILLLINPAEVSQAVSDAIYSCLEVMIPSLFSFTVLSIYLQGSGYAKYAFKPLTVPLSKLLRLEEELCTVVLLSNIGGYPVGAKLLTSLVKSGRLKPQDASRLMCCCYGSGPAFVIGIVGVRMYGSGAVGAIVFIACFMSSLIIAVMVCRKGDRIALSGETSVSHIDLVDAVRSGTSVMMTVCMMIVAFAVVIRLLDIIGVLQLAQWFLELLGGGDNSAEIVYSLLEISHIREIVPSAWYVIPLCAMLLSFGGVCVQLQVKAVVGEAFSLKQFLLSRIPAAAISAMFALPALLLPDAAVECLGDGVTSVSPFSVNAMLSLCVLIMSGLLLCPTPKSVKG